MLPNDAGRGAGAVDHAVEPAEEHAREEHQRLGEDDRHDAAVVHAERQVLALPAVDPAAAGVLGLLDRDAALRLGDQDRPGDDEDERADQEDDLADADRRRPGRRRGSSSAATSWPIATGMRATMPARMISEMPLPRPYSSICSPSHIRKTQPAVRRGDAHRSRSSRCSQNCRCTSGGAGVVHVAEPEDRLDDAQRHGRVARPLLDLLAPGLAFLLELLQRRDDGREELEDDRGRDVRHDAEAEDRALREVAAGEQRDVVGEPPGGAAVLRLVSRRAARTPSWSTPGIGTW